MRGTAVAVEDVFFDLVYRTRKAALDMRLHGALNDAAHLRDNYLRAVRSGGPEAERASQRATKLNDLINQYADKENPHRQQFFGPTAEMVVRPGRYDPVEKLVENGVLAEDHKRSARSLARLFEAVTSAVAARCSNLNPDRLGGSGHFDGLRVSESVLDRYHHIYKPWADEMHRSQDQHLPLVIDICIDGASVKAARLRHRMGREKAITRLKSGLELYGVRWLSYRDEHEKN